MSCCKCWAGYGTVISYLLILLSSLLPLSVSYGESISVNKQIETELRQLISKELKQWQHQSGVKSLKYEAKVRVPSGAKNLQACSEPLTIDAASGLVFGNIQRRVQCESQGWSMFVRARVKVSASIPVANRAMKRGELVSRQDIEWQSITLTSSDRHLMTKIDEIVGRQVIRGLRRHKPIQVQQLSAPQWVNIGDKVIIEARSNGFYANMQGEALESGGEGQAIRVKNLSSGKVITAYPTAKGRVVTQF
ncbi:flagellar basal body P-ring formation chaperone FlgA [Shewanella eurypsychrophilus]|uniref:Flagella basal body P-ring formation protein FlgA n=1 Tax=Shewanella eurypsychrophilus TaxID=2593656 RepID=A0ABX6V0M3_9GAMM|nr:MULTISPECIES: flagellar basal body P-ring formation chaperone FlgA [Shewanella]QFU20480.1 flagellar basal body P-ring formation protein FlgA [Shewanella sp. YLB-09]QFU20761.1 flagellar basal body P-ring formation protein FlgA [Shewanella sp. YLB-09]QPG56057.1 flagellar basal body P-ring formation chaperone FlgA [Shewanella eurypsychrophilus]